MASIVELRQMSDEKLAELLENAREEIFNLRFQHASARLDDISRLRRVRRDIGQLETVLHQRHLAVQAALEQAEVASALLGQDWHAEAHFDYEDSCWHVSFLNEDEEEIARTQVDLNRKRAKGRKARKTPK